LICSASPSRREKGLTLIELSIVLLVMAIIVGLAFPRILVITDVNLRTSARRLAETLQLLSSQAIAHGRPFGVLYDLDKQRYCWAGAQEDPETGEWVAVLAEDEKTEILGDPLAATRCQALKDGVYFRDIETPEGAERVQEKGRLTHFFSPRGTAESLVIHLADKKGRNYSVFLHHYGGRVEVRQGKVSYKDYVQQLLE
jgi:type II secretion system protein H